MNKSLFFVALPLIPALLAGPFASGGEASPEQCQRLKERIEKYTELRRGGGSGSQMTAWKRARSEAEAAYRDYNCHLQGQRMIRISGSK
jgi:hypothetical protein